MGKQNRIYRVAAIAVCVMLLPGCASVKSDAYEPDNTEDSRMQAESNRKIEEYMREKAKEEESPTETEFETETVNSYLPAQAPELPKMGREISDFIPDGWILKDSVELDFNEDKKPDYVGVLEKEWDENEENRQWYPRILFAIRSTEAGDFQLDFQNENLIRTKDEGSAWDPCGSLTAEGVSFTTHRYGGSACRRWSEHYTYTYKKGTWYLTASEDTYGYDSFVTSYSMDDWEKGIGIRKEWNDDFAYVEEHWDEEVECDISYEVSLDEPPTLYQAGMRWWLAANRVTDWSVKTIDIAAGISITEEQVISPGAVYWYNHWYDYCDENCLLYTFTISGENENPQYFLAMYRWEEQSVFVLAESDTPLDDSEFYKGKIYYSSEIVEEVAYKEVTDGTESVVREEDTVGVRLNRIDEDGGNHEIVYEYRCPEAEEEVLEDGLPYVALIYEIGGDEIWLEVYNRNGTHLYYRMNTDGSNLQAIGQVPKEQD